MTKSKIEWTDRSNWNPLRGCTRFSPGCVHCYAEAIAARFSGPGQAFHEFAERTSKGPRWTGKVELVEDRLTMPLRWRKPEPGRNKVFASSTSDIFHELLSDEDIDRIFAVMALAPDWIFQVLTKRSARMRAYFEARRSGDPWAAAADHIADLRHMVEHPAVPEPRDLPFPNIWLGVSVEDQERADERREDLANTPAAVKFVSYEPALGPVDWDGWEFVDQIISGGESGPRARPAHPDWFRETKEFCGAYGIAYFHKQNGEHAPGEIAGDYLNPSRPAKGLSYFDGRWDECWSEPEGHRDDEPDVYRIGRARAGRMLDGVEHNGFPEVAHG